MSSATATIRVPLETRDLLAKQARAEGVSISAALTQWAHEREREVAFLSERKATLADAGVNSVATEEREWESALDDGA